MFALRSIVRDLSHFVGTSKALVGHKDLGSISSFSLQGPNTLYTPSSAEIIEVISFINSTGHVKSLNLSQCILSKEAAEALAQGLVVDQNPLKSLTVQAKGLGENIVYVFSGLCGSKKLEFFEARGVYGCNGRSSLNEASVTTLADTVRHNPTLMQIRLDHIAIEKEHRSIILKPYEEISDRRLADIRIAGFVNGAQYPEHPQVNDKHFVDRVPTPQGCTRPRNSAF